MSLDPKLDRVVARHQELSAMMASEQRLDADSFAKAAKEYAELTPIAEAVTGLRAKQRELPAPGQVGVLDLVHVGDDDRGELHLVHAEEVRHGQLGRGAGGHAHARKHGDLRPRLGLIVGDILWRFLTAILRFCW